MSGDGPDTTTIGETAGLALVIYGVTQIFGAGGGGGPLRGLGGTLQAQARAARAQYLSQALYQREAQALHTFEQQTPGGVGQLYVNEPIDPKAQKLAEAAIKIENLLKSARSAKKAKKLAKKEAHIQAKLAKRELEISPQAEIRVSNIYGPNAGYWPEYGAPPPAFLLQRSH